MIIRRSIKTSQINQFFGENRNNFYKELGMLGHEGLDFSSYHGEPIYWDTNIIGEVVKISTEINEGYGMMVITQEGNDYYQHRFWHLKDWSVKVGQKLRTGDLIGHADNTGKSTGVHLHRDLKPLVKNYLGILVHKYPDNGYKGAVDPMPFYQDIFIWDWISLTKQKTSIIQKLIYLYQELIKRI
mgnify:CR=1 FL=1